MKRIILILLVCIIVFSSHAQKQTINNGDSGLSVRTKLNSNFTEVYNGLDAKINADYVIEKVGATYYARPSGSYTAYSDANFKIVIESAIGQLTSGGVVYIKAGLYDNLDPIVVLNNNITIQGAGKKLTKLKLKASADVGLVTRTGFIQCVGYSYLTIKDIELDGNRANQTIIDSGASETAKFFGILFGFEGSTSAFALIENCYVHDFTCNGIQLAVATDCIIRNCIVNDNNWNNISLSNSNRNLIQDCHVTGCADVSISIEGSDNTTKGCTIGDTYGVNGSLNGHWAIGIETQLIPSYRNNIIDNTITGAHTTNGIRLMGDYVQYDTFVTGNYVYDMPTASSMGIVVQNGKNITVSNNRILRVNGQGIVISAATTYSEVSGNNIDNSTDGTDTTGSYGINIDVNSTYNKILNNVVINHYAMNITSGSNNNYILNNYFHATAGWNYDFKDLGTGNIKINNILFGLYGSVNSLAPETVNKNFAVTATVGGLTTGILTGGSQNITVTSSNAAYIVCLPVSSTSTFGTKITGFIGANGFKLGVAASQATTVYLNNVTSTTPVKYAAIPANSYFEVTCIDATHWILRAWTNLGAPITAIVPA